MKASDIHLSDIRKAVRICGRWLIRTDEGVLLCDPAPDEPDDTITFTAPDGRRYYDIEPRCRWYTLQEWEKLRDSEF